MLWNSAWRQSPTPHLQRAAGVAAPLLSTFPLRKKTAQIVLTGLANLHGQGFTKCSSLPTYVEGEQSTRSRPQSLSFKSGRVQAGNILSSLLPSHSWLLQAHLLMTGFHRCSWTALKASEPRSGAAQGLDFTWKAAYRCLLRPQLSPQLNRQILQLFKHQKVINRPWQEMGLIST